MRVATTRVLLRRLSLAWPIPGLLLVALSAVPDVASAQATPCSAEPTDMIIEFGQAITCAIDVVGDVDRFTFHGQAGETIRLHAVRHLVSSAYTACLKVFDPDDVVIFEACGHAPTTTRVLDKTGTYVVLVNEGGDNRTMPYTTTLERIAPLSPTARSIGYGQTVTDNIDVRGDTDLLLFNGVAGDLIELQAIRHINSSAYTVCLDLFDPDVQLVHAGCHLDAVTMRTLTKTGTYVALVGEGNHDRAMGYSVTLTCISGVCPEPPKPPAFQISGQVRDQNDSPVAHIPITLSGGASADTTTDASGQYVFTGLAGGLSYTVTPERPLFTFNPGSQTFPNLAQDETAAPFVITSGVFTRYFAEGATGPFFTTDVALLNATGSPSDALVRFQRPDGATVDVPLSLEGLDHRTVNPADYGGLGNTAVSTIVESTQPLIADRTMRWDASGYGSHTETSIAAPLTQWYLAEGATIGGFQLFYLIQNPGQVPAAVDVTYLRAAPHPPLTKRYAVPASSRFNIWVNVEQFDTGSGPRSLLAAAEFSATFHSDVPVIVERAMYLNRHGRQFDAGHESAASPELSTTWFLAEGATGPFFDLFALIVNPNADDAQVEVTYLLASGAFTKAYTVARNSRFNIWADVDDPRLADTAVSMAVVSTNDVPILVERAMWWPGGFDTWLEGHNSRGAIETGEKWGLADGQVGGLLGIETYVLIANTSAFDALVQVTVVFDDGTTAVQSYPVAATSRFNVPIGEFFPATVGRRFGVVVESLPVAGGVAQIVVERASYNDAVQNGQVVRWAAGANAFGTKLR